MGVRVAAVVFGIAAGCGCPEVTTGVSAESYGGVRGTLYLVPMQCRSDACAEPVAKQGRVRVFQGSNLVAEGAADSGGRFEVALAPASYAVELLAPGAQIDRSYTALDVGADGGFHIVAVLQEEFEADALWIGFAESVTTVRQNEILAAEGLWAEARRDANVYVFIPEGDHPQLIGEALVEAYPGEVLSFEFGVSDCPN